MVSQDNFYLFFFFLRRYDGIPLKREEKYTVYEEKKGVKS